MKSNKTLLLLIILLIVIFHFFFQNGLEKIFFQTFLPYDFVKRPLPKCNSIFNRALSCVGMPSGHAECITIMSILLYHYKFISFIICFLCILIFSGQRIIAGMHNYIQVFVGILFGFIYSFIYLYFELNYKALIAVLCISFVLLLCIINHLEKEVHKPIPAWVSSSMLSSIKKKQDSPYYIKMLTIIANAFFQEVTFISWENLETYLDMIVKKIKATGVKYDAVVGIKTGGAILSDYVSKKLQIKNYKIKLSKEKYHCDKKTEDVFNDINDRLRPNNYIDYTICEGIQDNIQGKNVILIDELVSSGNTLAESYRYLKESKKVNEIYVTSIAINKNRFIKQNLKIHFTIHHLLNNSIVVWPWGYEN